MDCHTEIFADLNMVMLKDSLWNEISSDIEDVLCDYCIERKLGRSIALADFKTDNRHPDGWTTCNYLWWKGKRDGRN